VHDMPAPGPLWTRTNSRGPARGFDQLSRSTGSIGRNFGSVTVSELIRAPMEPGEVVEVAPDVWRVKVGDRVALTFNPDWIGGPYQQSPAAAGRGGAIPGCHV